MTYPRPPNFHGTTFLKQALVELNADRSALYQPHTGEAFAKATAPLWATLDQLHPHLWRAGKQFPQNAEAMRQIQKDPPALVVLDIQMPGIDGPSFALALRKALRHVPLVILTGVDDPKHEADRCNAEAYLSKPFNAPELVKVVRRFAT